MAISWRAADRGFGHSVIGFVERIDAVAPGAMRQLPFAMPVVHVSLDPDCPRAAICTGAGVPGDVSAPGPVRTFVIALGFAAAGALAVDEPRTMVDRFVALDGASWRSLSERLATARDFAARVELVERCLASRTDDLRRAADRPVVRAADAIAGDRWRGRVDDLAHAIGMEQRTLRNRFRREVGWSAKHLLDVARFNRALRTTHPQPWGGRGSDHVRLEFFDDAHFHRQFRRHAGMTPNAYAGAQRRGGQLLYHVRLDG